MAEETDSFAFDFGRFHISSTPKFLEDGLQNDFLFGMFYTDAMKIAGDLRVRYINGSQGNVKLWDIDDSMISRSRQVYEVFLLPFNYYFFRSAGFTVHAGAGLYFDFNKLNENGYFNDSSLYDPPGPDNYSAYTNDFSAFALGPIIDIGLGYKNDLISAVLSLGCVPAYYLNRNQSWKLSPYMYPEPSHSVSSESFYGPYVYGNLDFRLDLTYVSILASVLGEYSRLQYTAAGIDDTGAWADVQVETENKVFAFEISLLVHLGESGILPQIGYGMKFDEAAGNGSFLLLGARKEWF